MTEFQSGVLWAVGLLGGVIIPLLCYIAGRR